MALKLTFKDDRIEAIGTSSSKLLSALEVKMTSLMTRLQDAARAKLDATKSPKSAITNQGSGALSDSISNPRAETDGSKIVGRLDWGKDVPYAKLQEYGGTKAYIINALTEEGTKGSFQKGEYGQLLWKRNRGKGQFNRYGANVLQFIGVRSGGGELVYAPSVFRKTPLPARMFMHGALDELRTAIVEELRATIVANL